MNDFYNDIQFHKDDNVDEFTQYRSLSSNIDMLEDFMKLKGNDKTDLFFAQSLHDLHVSVNCLINNRSTLIKR